MSATPRAIGFRIQAAMCATCIYRPESPLDLARLEAEIADPQMAGFFAGYRVCHHAADADGLCCRGFWDRHNDQFTAGQLAQRLGMVTFVPSGARSKTDAAP